MAETQEFRQPFCVSSLSKDNLKKVQTRIVHYRGLVKGIEWRDEDPGRLYDLRLETRSAHCLPASMGPRYVSHFVLC